MPAYDAVLIPGGGLTLTGEPTAWVLPRLQAAIQQPGEPWLIPLSVGTAHKPPPFDGNGRPITEAGASAAYLIAQGIAPERILCEACSYDTIGNAFFARILHLEPRGLRRLLVITSDFHMPRTKAIFECVFSLKSVATQANAFELTYLATPDIGVEPAALEQRKQHESQALQRWQETSSNFPDLAALHHWLFTEHEIYASGKRPTTRDDATY